MASFDLCFKKNIDFDGPFHQESNAKLEITNPSDRRIFYKMKTTMPKSYCVRPNSQIFEPHSTNVIELQRLIPKENESTDDRKRHKFRISWVVIPDSCTLDRDEFWTQQPFESKDLKHALLTCIFTDQLVNKPVTSPSNPSLNTSFCEIIATVEETAETNDNIIEQIDQMTGDIKFITYTVTDLDNESYSLREGSQVTPVPQIVAEWRHPIELIPIIDTKISDQIDYHCDTYVDMRRLNRDMLDVVQKSKQAAIDSELIERLEKFNENLIWIQDALRKLLQLLRTGGRSASNDIRQRLGEIVHEIKCLLETHKNVKWL